MIRRGGFDLQRGDDVALLLAERGGLGHGPRRPGEGDEVEALKLAAQVAPGLIGLALGDAIKWQRQPADLDVGAVKTSRERAGGRRASAIRLVT